MSSNIKVNPQNFDDALIKIMDEYADEVCKSIPETVDHVAKQGKKLLKAYATSAGIGGRKYKNSFKVVKGASNAFGASFTLASSEYQLTHLLEKGHAKRNQYGSYSGTTKAYPHWAKAEEDTAKLLENELTKTISQIG